MRACGIFVLICIVLTRTTSAGGPCEKIENFYLGDSLGTVKTCHMSSTAIDSNDFSISSDRDVTVEGFYAFINKNLKYLPNNLGVKFPNLLCLNARKCSVKEISKHNFDGLSKLRYLSLSGNQIENIDDDTFEYIPAVEAIYLCENFDEMWKLRAHQTFTFTGYNKIKKLNGSAFASLHKLTEVYLSGNECIHADFDTPERITEMSRTVTEKCGFAIECNIETCLSEKAKLEAALKIQQEEVSRIKLKTERLESKKAQIESLHNEIKAQLLLVSVTAFVTVAALVGIILALIKKQRTNSDSSFAFRSSALRQQNYCSGSHC